MTSSPVQSASEAQEIDLTTPVGRNELLLAAQQAVRAFQNAADGNLRQAASRQLLQVLHRCHDDEARAPQSTFQTLTSENVGAQPFREIPTDRLEPGMLIHCDEFERLSPVSGSPEGPLKLACSDRESERTAVDSARRKSIYEVVEIGADTASGFKGGMNRPNWQITVKRLRASDDGQELIFEPKGEEITFDNRGGVTSAVLSSVTLVGVWEGQQYRAFTEEEIKRDELSSALTDIRQFVENPTLAHGPGGSREFQADTMDALLDSLLSERCASTLVEYTAQENDLGRIAQEVAEALNTYAARYRSLFAEEGRYNRKLDEQLRFHETKELVGSIERLKIALKA